MAETQESTEEQPSPIEPDLDLNFTLPPRLFASNKSNISTSSRTVLHCIDCHAAGEPARVVVGGFAHLLPSTILHGTALEKRTYFMDHLDHLRQLLLFEPRGYPCQNVNFVFPMVVNNDTTMMESKKRKLDTDSTSENNKNNNSQYQYVIGEQNKIYPLMSGHNTICVATALLECGLIHIPRSDGSNQENTNDSNSRDNSEDISVAKFTLEAPAGPIDITAKLNREGKALSIAFQNAPSFVEHLDVVVQVPSGIGPVTVDIAYGGMWYAVVNIEQFQTQQPKDDSNKLENPTITKTDNRDYRSSMKLDPDNATELCRVGEMIKVACREQYPVQHPSIDYPGVDILVFRETTTSLAVKGDDLTTTRASDKSPNHDRLYAKNTVVMSNKKLQWDKPETWTAMLDRSPCGTGTCAVMAVLHARGELQVGQEFVHESIVGTKFVGTILQETTISNKNKTKSYPAIVPQVSGSAYITQYSQVVVDKEDPFPKGFRVRDIW